MPRWAHRPWLVCNKNGTGGLGLKYTEPNIRFHYTKAESPEPERKNSSKFIVPLRKFWKGQGIKTKVIGRPKSIYLSIIKIKTKGVPLERIV